MADVLHDLRTGVRMLRQRLGMSALAVVALALGIGLTTTMFSIVNGAVLRGLPFEESERILHLARMRPAESSDDIGVTLHDYLDWRDAQTTFEDIAAFTTDVSVLSGSGEAAERLRSARVTANTFGLLGAVPVLGRDFVPADNLAGAPAVVVIGDRVWDSQFARRDDALGQTLRINGVPTTVIGVMPSRFRFPTTQDVWLPLELTRPELRGDGEWLEVIGRLGPGITEGDAQVELAAIAARLAGTYPANEGMTAITQPYLREFLGTEVISTLFAMLGAVFGVLLVACANVTNLQVARMAERTREFAIRTAMGAGRWRVVRQLLLEGLVLTTCGAVLGVALATGGVWLFNRAIVDTNPPFWIDIRIDTAVLAFVVGITAAAAIISSLWPALRVTQAPTSQVLNDQGRGSTSLKVGVMTRTLVIVAVTLSCGLLLVSGLMIKTVSGLANIRYDFAHEDVLTARLSADARRYATADQVRRLTRDLEERLTTVPGALAGALATNSPSDGGRFRLTIEGKPYQEPDDRPVVRRSAVSPGFFDALAVEPLAGRLLSPADRDGALLVTLVDSAFVARYYPHGDAVGRRIRLSRDADAPWLTIVGVVPALMPAALDDDAHEITYVPLDQAPSRDLYLFQRTTQEPTSLTRVVRQAVGAVDPDIAMFEVSSLADSLRAGDWAFRVFGTLFMSFGFAAFVMAIAGLYGVLAFAVRRRTQEIGVRMALGADRQRIVGLVLRQGLIYVVVGLVAGVGIGLILGPLMQELLVNVGPRDPTVFGTTLTSLFVTGLAASLVPALKAAAVDPWLALRHD